MCCLFAVSGASPSVGAAALRGGNQGRLGVRLLYQRPGEPRRHRQRCLQTVTGGSRPNGSVFTLWSVAASGSRVLFRGSLLLFVCELKAAAALVDAAGQLNVVAPRCNASFALQSRMEDKVERFKKAVEYFSAASKPRSPNMGPSSFICEWWFREWHQ